MLSAPSPPLFTECCMVTSPSQPVAGSGTQLPRLLMTSEEAISSTRVRVQCGRCCAKPFTLINLDVDDSPILWGKHYHPPHSADEKNKAFPDLNLVLSGTQSSAFSPNGSLLLQRDASLIWCRIEPFRPQQQSSYMLLNSTPRAPLQDPHIPCMDQKQYRVESWRGIQQGITDASVRICVCLWVCKGVCGGVCVDTDDQRQMMVTEK